MILTLYRNALARAKFVPLILWLGIVLAYIPHISIQPVMVNVSCLALLAWRLIYIIKPVGLPPRWVVYTITLFITLLLISSDPDTLGRNTGIGILCLALMVNHLYHEQVIDTLTLVGLAFFVASMTFTHSQSITMIIIVLLSVYLLLTALVNGYSGSLSGGYRFRQANKLLLVALPVAAILLFTLPQFNLAMSQMAEKSNKDGSGTTGLASSMSPGNITQLKKNHNVAFRVKFDVPPDDYSRLYWRGPVLTHYNGQTWSNVTARPGLSEKVPRNSAIHPMAGNAVKYTVTMGAQAQKWIMALDVPSSFSIETIQTRDRQILAPGNANGAMQYSVVSYPGARRNSKDDPYQKRYLGLPNLYGHKTRALAESFYRQAKSSKNGDRMIVDKALDYFRRNPFVYTLNPAPIRYDPVEEFLFNTREGFCEHYASSFVFIMRAAGVPARVVTGYHGGEYNAVDDYLVVRNANAHAWAEVWLKGVGWTRVDPTAVIPDHRVRLDDDTPAGSFSINQSWVSSLLDVMDFYWNRAYIALKTAFNDMLSWMSGMLSLAVFSVMGMCMTVLLLTAIVFSVFLSQRSEPAIHHYYYRKFCKKFEKIGLTRQPGETASHYAQRILSLRPDLDSVITQITRQYNQLRYSRQVAPGEIEAFKRCIRKLKV